jgi:hypothetical protein
MRLELDTAVCEADCLGHNGCFMKPGGVCTVVGESYGCTDAALSISVNNLSMKRLMLGCEYGGFIHTLPRHSCAKPADRNRRPHLQPHRLAWFWGSGLMAVSITSTESRRTIAPRTCGLLRTPANGRPILRVEVRKSISAPTERDAALRYDVAARILHGG